MACLVSGSIQSFFLFQEQEDPNKLATSWPDYYIDRINSMAAVSGAPLLPCPHLQGLWGEWSPLIFPCTAHPTHWGSAAFHLLPRVYHKPSLLCAALESPHCINIY